MEERCALCQTRAAMLCESDEAKLCWECDEKVHSANFLVAKHWRVLLCRFCYSPTPWKASGTNLTPTLSFCTPCLADRQARLHRLINNLRQRRGVRRKEGDDEALPLSSASATSPPTAPALPFNPLTNSSSMDSHDEAACSSSEMLDATLGGKDE